MHREPGYRPPSARLNFFSPKAPHIVRTHAILKKDLRTHLNESKSLSEMMPLPSFDKIPAVLPVALQQTNHPLRGVRGQQDPPPAQQAHIRPIVRHMHRLFIFSFQGVEMQPLVVQNDHLPVIDIEVQKPAVFSRSCAASGDPPRKRPCASNTESWSLRSLM